MILVSDEPDAIWRVFSCCYLTSLFSSHLHRCITSCLGFEYLLKKYLAPIWRTFFLPPRMNLHLDVVCNQELKLLFWFYRILQDFSAWIWRKIYRRQELASIKIKIVVYFFFAFWRTLIWRVFASHICRYCPSWSKSSIIFSFSSEYRPLTRNDAFFVYVSCGQLGCARGRALLS